MSYTYLRDAGEESLAECFSDIAPCALSRLSRTDALRCSNANETASFPGSPSGTTCELSMAVPGMVAPTSLPAASRVRISARRDVAPDLTASAAGFGVSTPESWARYDRESCSWKTHQCSLLGGLEPFSGTWPRWGIMRAGECFPLPMPSGLAAHRALITSVSESGLWQRMETPTKQDGWNRKPSQNFKVTATGRTRHLNAAGVESQERLCQQVQRMPTITKADSNGRTYQFDNHDKTKPRLSLLGLCRLRTPTASDATKWNNKTVEERLSKGQSVRLPNQLEAGGSLNPLWVEWLMGWPLGWTALQPLAMDKFRQWSLSHGGRSGPVNMD